jgi:hypothetical protein
LKNGSLGHVVNVVTINEGYDAEDQNKNELEYKKKNSSF